MCSNMGNWKPHIGQKIFLKRVHNNNYNKLAAAKTLLKGRIGAVTVGHIPRELSLHAWYAIQKRTKFQATVDDSKAKLLYLIQGRLEIPIKVKLYDLKKKRFWGLKQKLKLSTQWQTKIMMTQSLC